MPGFPHPGEMLYQTYVYFVLESENKDLVVIQANLPAWENSALREFGSFPGGNEEINFSPCTPAQSIFTRIPYANWKLFRFIRDLALSLQTWFTVHVSHSSCRQYLVLVHYEPLRVFFLIPPAHFHNFKEGTFRYALLYISFCPQVRE